MIVTLIIAVGLVMLLEGLVYTLAPSLVEDLLKMISNMSRSDRRRMGILVTTLGAVVIYGGMLLS